MAGEGHGHHGDHKVTFLMLLRLYCWLSIILFYTKTGAEARHEENSNASSTVQSDSGTSFGPASMGRAIGVPRIPSVNETRQLSWVLGVCPGNTCRNRCGEHFSICSFGACSCDRHCRLFNDCCPDFGEVCLDEVKENFTDAFLQKHSRYMSYISHDVYEFESNIKKIKWIRKCPQFSDAAIVIKCEKPSPLSVSTYLQYAPALYDGFLFRNKYCAMCHGMVDSYDLITFSLSCIDKQIQSEMSNAFGFGDLEKVFDIANQNCLIKYHFTDIHKNVARFLTYVERPYWNQCPSKISQQIGIDLTGVCESYQSILSIGVGSIQIPFNNPHCALCNGISIGDIIDYSTCGISLCTDYVPAFKSLEILVDVAASIDADLGEMVGSSRLCPLGHIEDALKRVDKCVPTACPLGLIANGSNCLRAYEPVTQAFNKSEEEYTIVFVPRVNSSIDLIKLRHQIMASPYVAEVKSIDSDAYCEALPPKAAAILQDSADHTMYECLIAKVKVEIKVLQRIMFIPQLYPFREVKNKIIQILVFNYDISLSLECRMGRGIDSDNAVLYGQGGNVFVKDVGYTWPPGEIQLMISKDFDETRPVNLSVKICVKDWVAKDDNPQYDQIKIITTLVGNVISLLALFLILVSFCILASFKGIVRILMINLVIALFMSQSTFVAESFLDENTVTCHAVGIFQHYSWLAYFFLMNATAIEMTWGFRSLQGMVMARAGKPNKGRLAGLLLYGWLCPLCLVIPGIILDMKDHDTLSPRYGRNGGCWLNNQSALLYFFVIPFSVIVGLNTILILFTVIRIRATSSHKSMLPFERDFFQINLRLSTLMGLSWLLGLVATYSKSEPVWYAFIVLNTLQGVILFFSFTPPQKTFQHLAQKSSGS